LTFGKSWKTWAWKSCATWNSEKNMLQERLTLNFIISYFWCFKNY
jgi:hypothetical protein